jgi:arylsulfatase A-like enzyme
MDLFSTILDYLGLLEETDMADVPARSFAPELAGEAFGWDDVVFLEQEETRAIRTAEWLHVKRFQGSGSYPLEDELYDLNADADERRNLAGDGDCATIERDLAARLDAYFDSYADPRFDLWRGGSAKSNVSRPWLWKDAWGPDWETVT